MHTRIIAHRGHTGKFPENTISAFSAAKNSGADAIELDVHMSADGALVVHHDYYLGHPDNGHGKIHESLWSDMRNLVIGDSERIPTLNQVFETFGSSIHYEIELKGISEDFIPTVVSLIKYHNLFSVVECTSPHTFALARLKEAAPSVKAGYFVPQRPPWMDKELSQALALYNAASGGISVIHAELEFIDTAFIRDAHVRGLDVHAADCNIADNLERAFVLEVDQLSTNSLDLAIQLRSQITV